MNIIVFLRAISLLFGKGRLVYSPVLFCVFLFKSFPSLFAITLSASVCPVFLTCPISLSTMSLTFSDVERCSLLLPVFILFLFIGLFARHLTYIHTSV